MHWSIAPLYELPNPLSIPNDETVLTVCDNGLGIDLKEHGKISLTKCSISTLTQKEFFLMKKAQVEGMGGTISVEYCRYWNKI
jgi:sensor histidine kinase regulating citrate/malate metabolism